MEDNKQFDLDISTEEGKMLVKQKISEAIYRFNDDDKIFISKLLFLLLESVGEQQMYNDHIFNELNNICKFIENYEREY